MECASRTSLIWFCCEPCGGKRLALAALCDMRSSRVRRICYALRVANFLLYLRRNPRLARVATAEGCAMGDRHCAAGSVTVAAPYSAAYVSSPPHGCATGAGIGERRMVACSALGAACIGRGGLGGVPTMLEA